MQSETTGNDGPIRPISDERVRFFARLWFHNRARSQGLHQDSINCVLALYSYSANMLGRIDKQLRLFIIWDLDGDKCFLQEFRCLYNQDFLMEWEINEVLRKLDMPPLFACF